MMGYLDAINEISGLCRVYNSGIIRVTEGVEEMIISLESGHELSSPFGSALSGTRATNIRIGTDELNKHIANDGAKRTMSYITNILLCRIAPRGELQISRPKD